MIQRRASKQRDIIRQYLYGRIDHPTADKLYNQIKVEYPKMSLGTIYRNLIFLSELGEIQAVEVGDSAVHFDPNPKPHAHFFCTECREVTDLALDDFEKISSLCKNSVDGSIQKINISITGTCNSCNLKKLN